MTGSQCDITLPFDLSIDHSTTPAPEPGPSNVPRLNPVFDMGPDSEVEENDEENDERNDEPEGSGGDCVYFRADIESESEDNDPLGICLEDPRLARRRKHVRWKSIHDRIVLRTPLSWYNLMPPEKVAIGRTSKTFSISQRHQIQLVSTYSLTWYDYPQRDASMKPIRYKNGDMEAVRAFSVATIDCVSGRVKMGKWCGTIDRSIGPQRINIYDIQVPEYESEDNFSISCGM